MLKTILPVAIFFASFMSLESAKQKSLSQIYSTNKPTSITVVKKNSSSLIDIYSKSRTRSKVQSCRRNYANSARENARVFGGESIHKHDKIRIGDVIEVILETTTGNTQNDDDSPIHTSPRPRNVL